jgi:hypothetical protein
MNSEMETKTMGTKAFTTAVLSLTFIGLLTTRCAPPNNSNAKKGKVRSSKGAPGALPLNQANQKNPKSAGGGTSSGAPGAVAQVDLKTIQADITELASSVGRVQLPGLPDGTYTMKAIRSSLTVGSKYAMLQAYTVKFIEKGTTFDIHAEIMKDGNEVFGKPGDTAGVKFPIEAKFEKSNGDKPFIRPIRMTTLEQLVNADGTSILNVGCANLQDPKTCDSAIDPDTGELNTLQSLNAHGGYALQDNGAVFLRLSADKKTLSVYIENENEQTAASRNIFIDYDIVANSPPATPAPAATPSVNQNPPGPKQTQASPTGEGEPTANPSANQ